VGEARRPGGRSLALQDHGRAHGAGRALADQAVLPAAALENKLKVEIPNDWLPRTGMYFVKTNCGEQVHVLKFVRL